MPPATLRKCKPVRNSAARIEREDGRILLEVPGSTGPPRLSRLFAKIARMPDVRRYELEEIGAFVWDRCDGRQTFEKISKQLRDEYQMSRIESDAALEAFLQTLSRRGLVALMAPIKP